MLVVFILATGGIVVAAAARAKCGGKVARAGTPRADVIKGNHRPNVFNGLGGPDTLVGLGGSDKLCGGPGSDVITGAAGKDLLDGSRGNDRIDGGGGSDSLLGGGGRDSLRGGAGNDKLVGGGGRDLLDGGPGFDTCSQGERYVSCERILPLVIQEVTLGVTNSSFNLPATGLAPGDHVARVLDLRNSSTVGTGQIALTTSASPATPLTTDTTDGLRVQIQRCSTQWSQVGADYSCSGATTTIVSERPAIVSGLTLPGLSSLNAGGLDHLVVRLFLPEEAGEHVAGASTLMTYTFVA